MTFDEMTITGYACDFKLDCGKNNFNVQLYYDEGLGAGRSMTHIQLVDQSHEK